MPAFEHAVSIGYRYLETDVHRAADGTLVAFHDSNLARTTGLDAEIVDLDWNEIESATAGGPAPVPRMRDLLERFPDARFNIDAKSDAAVDPLLELVVEFDALDRVCLASFMHGRLQRMRGRFGDRLATNLSRFEVPLLWATGRLPGSSPRAAQVPPSSGALKVVTERFVSAAHRAGCPVHVWTIDEPSEMHRLLDLGVDGIMTDDPAALRDVFIERGVWAE